MALDAMIVLTLNGGSSSVKFGLYDVRGSSPALLMTGDVDGDGLRAEDAEGRHLSTPSADASPAALIPAIAQVIADAHLPPPDAIGHRVVHGGPHLRSHCVIDEAVLRELDAVRALSPLHAPAALAFIGLARSTWPDVPQIACFDTVFHAAMPDLTRTLPLPRAFEAQGIRRYGFHGLSYESIVDQLGQALPPRLIIAHLGNGASVTAVRDGRSIDTSMGLTPSGGLVMGTRAGDIDPGILIYLAREKGYDPAALEQLVDHQSGLLGISERSSDMRTLHAAAPDPAARLAVDMFCLSAAKQIAGMIVSLDGVDMIVFTGGIGEHDGAVRAAICRHLSWLGVRIADGALDKAGTRIDDGSSRCQVVVLPSQEDAQIARHACALMAPGHVLPS